MKKYIVIMLATVLLFTTSFSAFAGSASQKVLFDLYGLGIISEDSSEEEAVTRGEFSEMIVNLMGMADLAEQMEPTARFTDVLPSATYAKSVALLSQIGVMNGVSEHSFAPDALVEYEQAVKVLVVCTGYENLAKNSGGWPNGYTSVASKNGLLKDVEGGTPFKRGELYQLIYNSLDIKLLVETVGSSENKLEKSGDTLRLMLMDSGSENIYKQTGVITANVFSYTDAAVSNLKENQVVIDSVIYEIGTTNADELLGHKVDFFAAEKEDKNGYVLLYICPSKKDNAVGVNASNVIGKKGNEFTYLDDEDNENEIEISEDSKVLYNGTRVLYPTDELFSVKNGKITFFDHDDDSKAEIVMIEEYVNLVAESFQGKLFRFRDGQEFGESNSLFVDTDKKGIMMKAEDADGNKVESFDSARTVSIAKDEAGTRYKVLVSDKTVEGVVKSYDDDTITVDETVYPKDKTKEMNVKLGYRYIMYLNCEGEIVFAESKHISNYAFLLGLNREGAFVGLEARMLLAGPVDFGIDVNDEDIDNTTQIPFLISQNAGVSVMPFASKVKINTNTFSGESLYTALSEIAQSPVSYKLNEEDEIIELTTPDVCGGDPVNRSKYNVYEMLFGGTSTVDGFGITKDTQVICVPNTETAGVANTTASVEDCMVTVKIDVDNNEVGYLVSGYDYNEDNDSARLLVIYSDMNAMQVRGVELKTSKASFVTSVTEKYDEETGETNKVVNILEAGVEHSLVPMDLTSKNYELDNLREGDLISFITNNNGLLENVKILRSFKDLDSDLLYSDYEGGYDEAFGQVTGMKTNIIDTPNNVRVTELGLKIGGNTYRYYIPQRNKPPIYIYERAKGEFKMGTINDIVPGDDRVYILKITGGAIRTAVIVR